MVTMPGLYTAVNHEGTVINSSHFAYWVLSELRSFFEVSYNVKNSQEWTENTVCYRLRHYKIRQ